MGAISLSLAALVGGIVSALILWPLSGPLAAFLWAPLAGSIAAALMGVVIARSSRSR
jgi:hypothetical protein